MTRGFREVFPELKTPKEIEMLLDEAQVEKVSTNAARTFVRVYLLSRHLIHRRDLAKLEQQMEKQLFPNSNTRAQLFVRFELSSQYTVESLMDLYSDSILYELEEHSLLEYHVFRKGEVSYPEENRMVLKLEDTLVAREVEGKLTELLEQILGKRCGLPIVIQTEFVEPKKNHSKEYVEQQMKHEIQRIVEANLEAEAERKKREELENRRNKEMEERAKGQKFQEGKYRARQQVLEDPECFYGKNTEGKVTKIADIESEESGEFVLEGQITEVDHRVTKNQKNILVFAITDFTDSIGAKLFARDNEVKELKENLQKGNFIRLKGLIEFDQFDGELAMTRVLGIKKISSTVTERMDNYPVKRVELHCHTNMSDMDGMTSAADLIKRLKKWGHSAFAITDHGVVQAFTEAWHALQKIEGKFNWEPFDFKVIHGVEAYLVDDLKDSVVNAKEQTLEDSFVVFDLETTGFSRTKNAIIEFGAVKIEGGKITDRFSTFVNPKTPIPAKIEKLTGIHDSMVEHAEEISQVLPKFLEFSKDCVLVGHNAGFDVGFVEANAKKLGMETEFTVVDTLELAHMLLPQLGRFGLNYVAKALGVSLENHHRAVDDAECTAHIFLKFRDMLLKDGVNTLKEMNEFCKPTAEVVKKMRSHHAVILAKNETGRVNLYRLISKSHIDYFYRQPRIPKSEYLKYSEGLMIGSACEAGELFQALVREESEEEIARLVEFYDYLEIQPIGNNAFMLRRDEYAAETEEDLKDYNRRIVALGEQFNKPVVATGDVHFLDPEDEIYRRILMAGKGFEDADDQAPLYLKTTEEMLEEFQYLGSDKAEEVVITNTNKIADQIENFFPVFKEKCPPVIENSDQTLREICYEKAYSMYGKELPEIVTERLERELNSIISNGFAVMYIIAQKLVWKSNEDGYLVGSRGSVGSSFVATMAGITEVNPLSPHYRCPSCFYTDFDSEEVKKYAGGAGCDMPDKLCPECGQPLIKDGFDIPFETFLGFKGNKEPDIDLNFSGEYQARAHAYTEEIFGEGHTFRAGTIGAIKEKNAIGFVKKYCEERGIKKRRAEAARMAQGCVGVRRTTGQHPGGIIVLPHGWEINTFTPIQRPANKMDVDIITTHFDYHSIDHNLLKLDILGHDDPTMIRMLEDLTGTDAKEVPLDDQRVMSLFKNTEALGIAPEDIGGCKMGSLGIPEFGTTFVIQMLEDTKPQTFSDLVRISGLSHGTDVWLGNAQKFIAEGKATISTAICTRDDIMTYLINKGMDKELSFTIMESVRKGKGLKDEWKPLMKEHGVEDWYIESCELIQYMFPKAHAAAYVMMAYRIAWYKINYPLAYYAAFFSIRAKAFDYGLMCLGKEKLQQHMKDYEERSETLSNVEKLAYGDMKIVQEMYARGYEFLPIDIYKAKATRFQIMDGKLMPSFVSINGLGENAAIALEEAAKEKEFVSRDEMREAAKLTKTNIDTMSELGILDGMPESRQLSIFDF